MRLIDADALMKEFPCTCGCKHCGQGKDGILPCDIKDKIKEAPTIDSFGSWIPVEERLPETDKKVLVILHNRYGIDVILMASHIGYHERTSEDYGWQEFEGDTEYDEENDCFWIPECWCESNYVEDNANWIIDECEGTITHWMPLPKPYEVKNNDT